MTAQKDFSNPVRDRRKFDGGAEGVFAAAPGNNRLQVKFLRPYRDRRLFEGGMAAAGGQPVRVSAGGNQPIRPMVKAPLRPAAGGVRFQRPMRSQYGIAEDDGNSVDDGIE